MEAADERIVDLAFAYAISCAPPLGETLDVDVEGLPNVFGAR
jgi:hypothetical protein